MQRFLEMSRNKPGVHALLLLICFLALGSCGEAPVAHQPKQDPTGEISVAIRMGKVAAANISRAEIVVTTGGTKMKQRLNIDGNTITGLVTGIPVGPAQFTLNGYNASDTLTYTGFATATITAGPSVPVNILVRRVGNGTSIGNRAPVADAGLDISVALGEAIVVDAAGSSDPDGDRLAYEWITASDAVIVNPASRRTGVLVNQPGVYAIQLTVTDVGLVTDTDVVTIVVSVPPIRFDGFYLGTLRGANFAIENYVRFYEDGTVLRFTPPYDNGFGGSATASLAEATSALHRSSQLVDSGIYTVAGADVSFFGLKGTIKRDQIVVSKHPFFELTVEVIYQFNSVRFSGD